MNAGDNVEILPNETLDKARAEREGKLARFEAWRIARSLVVPLDEGEVRGCLRARGQPICYFGEDAHDRRERLRALMVADVVRQRKKEAEGTTASGLVDMGETGRVRKDGREGTREEGDSLADDGTHGGNAQEVKHDEEEDEDEDEEFYTEGSADLRALRLSLALPSLKRARDRLTHEKMRYARGDNARAFRARVRDEEEAVVQRVRQSYTVASYVGDERPLSAISYAAAAFGRGATVATASWSGLVKIWRDGGDDADGNRVLQTFDKLHEARVSNVCFPRGVEHVLLTCGADGRACVLRRGEDGDGAFVRRLVLSSHDGLRVCDCKMHPFRHSLVVTAGFDGSFALHDGEQTVLRQSTGHERVYRTAFHPDGSLLATCGLDGGIRTWDLRSGRAVMTMTKAHADDVLGVEFCGDGRVLASGGMDNIVRIWDLRSVGCVKTVAAHRGLVSDVRFGGGVGEGDVLFTSSFDRSVKCWGARRNWGLVSVHTSYEDKVMALDCSADGRRVVAACYDKTWKVWGRDDDA